MSLTFRTRAEHGLEGAEAALLWEHGCTGISEEGGWLVAWFDEKVDLPLEGQWQEAPDIDYVARYYAEVEPVEAGPLVVTPSHAPVTLKRGQKPLWLDPGLAFGSGHHDTTHSLLRRLGELDLSGLHVLDVGAGSGILAIAADLLGAASATGIDNDRATVEVARENARLNRSRARFEHSVLAEFDGTDPFAVDPDTGEPVNEWTVGDAPPYRRRQPCDVLVANLFAALHVQLLPLYRQELRPGGQLLLSGILSEQAAEVEAALAGHGFTDVSRIIDSDWVSFSAVNTRG